MGDSGRGRPDVAVLSFCESYVVYLRVLYISYLPTAVFHTGVLLGLVLAKPFPNKLICLYTLSVDVV